MPVQEFAPHPLLARFIASFCYSERHFAPPHNSFDVLPDSMFELVYCFGAPCYLQLDQQELRLPPCFVVGLLEAPLRLRASGLVKTIRARLYPWSVYILLGTLLRAQDCAPGLAISWVDDTLQPSPATLEALLEQGGSAAIAALQHALIQRALAATPATSVGIVAAQQMLARNGNISIETLAQTVGLSERALLRAFRGLVGTNPKRLARTVRFRICAQ